MKAFIDEIMKYLAQGGLNILIGIIILVIGWWLAKRISKIVGKALNKTNLDKMLVHFFESLTYIALLVLVIVSALPRIGVPVMSFAAILGAAGLAIGLALQGSLANFASGVLLLIFKPFKVGDFIEAAGVKGAVKSIQIFNTVLCSPDNVKIIIPNAQITGGSIKNYTTNTTRRVDLVIGVSYDDDLKKTKEVIEQVLNSDERILKEPAYTVAVSELADSSVNFVVRPWVNTADYWNVYFDITAKIKETLDQSGITIPYPQRDIHIKGGAVKASIGA